MKHQLRFKFNTGQSQSLVRMKASPCSHLYRENWLLHVFMHSSVFCQLSVGGWTQVTLSNPHWRPSHTQATKCCCTQATCIHQWTNSDKEISSTSCRKSSWSISAWKNLPGPLHLHLSYRSIGIMIIHFNSNYKPLFLNLYLINVPE